MDDSAWGEIKLARTEKKLGLSVYPYAADFAGGAEKEDCADIDGSFAICRDLVLRDALCLFGFAPSGRS
jgi:hypothetical protein